MTKSTANLVVATATGDLLPVPGNQGGKNDSGVITVAAQLREIDMQGCAGKTRTHDLRGPLESLHGIENAAVGRRQGGMRRLEHGLVSIELGQRENHRGNALIGLRGAQYFGDLGSRLALKRIVQ